MKTSHLILLCILAAIAGGFVFWWQSPSAALAKPQRSPSAKEGSLSASGTFTPAPGAVAPAGPRTAEAMQAAAQGVRQLSADEWQVGAVTLHKRSRSLRFQAQIAARDLPLEYALVHETGKAHEALFVTSAAAQDIHVAALLLSAAGTAPSIEVSWPKHGSPARYALSDLIEVKTQSPQTLDAQDWRYNGSRFTPTGFAAQIEGSLIALVSDSSALLHHPSAGALQRDDVFFPRTHLLPPKGVAATLTLTFPPTTTAP
jgi:hypothetical protein